MSRFHAMVPELYKFKAKRRDKVSLEIKSALTEYNDKWYATEMKVKKRQNGHSLFVGWQRLPENIKGNDIQYRYVLIQDNKEHREQNIRILHGMSST